MKRVSKEREKMASIREVAKLAGVSPATVSRVMNGTANVDDEKKQRVLQAIEETGFKPNELARALIQIVEVEAVFLVVTCHNTVMCFMKTPSVTFKLS